MMSSLLLRCAKFPRNGEQAMVIYQLMKVLDDEMIFPVVTVGVAFAD
jgi:hypothetical protein